jgi:uncharacterized membrane protein YeaQ/YmgE (transglycosylase-associated protein family)
LLTQQFRLGSNVATLRQAPTSCGRKEELEMFGIIGWILFGLVAGVIAKLIMPGRDPGGIIVTILIGIAGAVMAGFAGQALGMYGEGESAGMIMSIIGAIALLALYRATVGRGVRRA